MEVEKVTVLASKKASPATESLCPGVEVPTPKREEEMLIPRKLAESSVVLPE